MKICKDGRLWGQNNKEASKHLGIAQGRYVKKGGEDSTHSENIKGDKNPFFGRHHLQETRRKLGHRGEKHWNWKGGLTDLNHKVRNRIEFRLWREAVFARDNWTCQKCKKRGVKIHAHHIKSLAQNPELRFALDNGITLCLECHKFTDNYAGRGE